MVHEHRAEPLSSALHWTPERRSVSISTLTGRAPVRANVKWFHGNAPQIPAVRLEVPEMRFEPYQN
jgi:hypothetical protein